MEQGGSDTASHVSAAYGQLIEVGLVVDAAERHESDGPVVAIHRDLSQPIFDRNRPTVGFCNNERMVFL
jgi:hypothetical protein